MKSLSFLYKSVSGLIITALLVGSLFINVTMFTWSDGAKAMSAAFSAMTGFTSVVSDIVDRNDALEKANGRLIKTNNDLEKRNKASKENAGKITKRMAKRTIRVAKINLLSVPAEAIPYVGIPIIAAVTTFEIKNSCDTMKDINELDKLFSNEEVIEVGDTKICAMKVPTLRELIAAIRKSPEEIYEKLKALDVPLPSWTAISIRSKIAWEWFWS